MTEEKLNEINEETVDNEKPSAETLEEVKETVEETVCVAVNETIEAVEEVKEEIKEVTEPVNEKIEEAVVEPVTEKAAEFVEEVMEKTEEVKEEAEKIKEEITEAVHTAAENAEETAAEAVEITENKVEEARETVEDAFKLTTIVPEEENTITEKTEEKISEAEEVKPEIKLQPKTEPVLGEAKRPTITVNTPKEEQDLQKELEKMRRDYRRAQREVNELVAQSNRKKSLSNFLLALLAFLTIGLSVGGSYLVTTLNNKKNEEEKLIVYEGVETNTNTNSNVNVSTDTTPSVTSSKDLTEVVANIEDCVVEVYTESVSYSAFYGEYVTGGAGSGVIYTSDGYIITNNHVIEDARSINVKLHDGTEYSAVLVATDEDTDLAVIKINATGLKQAVLGDSEKLKVGEGAIAIGNPLGTLGGTVTTGIVSALSREITIENKKMTLLQTNTAISPGNSGGGLFNTSGELIGIVNAKSSGDNVEGIGFAIPVNVVKAVIRDLITNGYVTGRPSIGIKCVSIDNQRYMMYYNVSDYGVYVSEVTSQSAITGGLQSGDLIVGINGETVTSYTDMKGILAEYKPGDVVTLTVLRGRNNRVDLEVALIEKNAVSN